MDTVYNAVVGLIDLDSMKNVMVAMMKTNCLVVDGDVCYETYADSEFGAGWAGQGGGAMTNANCLSMFETTIK